MTASDMQKVIPMALVSILSVSIEGAPFLPVGFLIAIFVVARQSGMPFTVGFRQNIKGIGLCLLGAAVGFILIRCGLDLSVGADESRDMTIDWDILPVRNYLHFL